jgi:hypothetical protein
MQATSFLRNTNGLLAQSKCDWEIMLNSMRVVVDGDVRFTTGGDYSGIESAPSVGPCFGSTVSVREFSITPLA